MRDGLYRSKLDILNGWEPVPRPVVEAPAEEHKAAIVIQKAQRCFAARRKLEEAQWAAQKIQSRVRGKQVRRKAAHKKKRRQEATVRIQKSYLQNRNLATAQETAKELREAFAGSPEMQRKVGLAMEQKVPLSELNLQHVVLGPESAERLAKALRNASTVKILDLGNCYIGCQGAGHLAKYLRFSQCLKRLALPWNSIGDDGAADLAKALPKLEALKDLDLSYNRIGDKGAESLAAALRAMPTLRSLALQANNINQFGATELISARREWLNLNLNGNNYEASKLASGQQGAPDGQQRSISKGWRSIQSNLSSGALRRSRLSTTRSSDR